MLRKIINWLFNNDLKKENKRLKNEIDLEKIGKKYIPVELWKGVTDNGVFMSPTYLSSIHDISNNVYFQYFLFDFKESILKDKDKYKPSELMATLKAIDSLYNNLNGLSMAYLQTQQKAVK